ncbi:hypothetical protein COGO111638_09180 [Corynebacterium gottingense]
MNAAAHPLSRSSLSTGFQPDTSSACAEPANTCGRYSTAPMMPGAASHNVSLIRPRSGATSVEVSQYRPTPMTTTVTAAGWAVSTPSSPTSAGSAVMRSAGTRTNCQMTMPVSDMANRYGHMPT